MWIAAEKKRVIFASSLQVRLSYDDEMRRAAWIVGLTISCGARTGLGVGSQPTGEGDASVRSDGSADGASRDGTADVLNPCPPVLVPTPLYTFSTGGVAIALGQDEAWLYAFRHTPNTNTGDLIRVPKCGGSDVTLASSILAPSSIDVDATRVYWAEGNAASKLQSMPKSGGPITALANVGTVPVPMLALHGSRLYYQASTNGTDVFVRELDLTLADGGADRTIGPSYGFFAVDTAHVYTRSKNLWLAALPIAGGNSTDLAVAPTAGRVAVDGPDVYFAENPAFKQGEVWVTGLGVPAKRVRQKLDVPSGLAVDATHVYVTEAGFAAGTGVVSRTPRAGGAVEVLASGQEQPEILVLDATSLYWLNYRGAIMKLDKP